MKGKTKTARAWLGLSVVVIFLDQLTKYWASHQLVLHIPRHVLPFLNWRLMHNTGAAFSFLSETGGWHRWLFAALALAVAVVLCRWLWRMPAKDRGTAMAMSLVLGGAVGNLLDRLMHGYVIDFIDFHWGNWHFATFNVADAAISIGVVLLLWFSLNSGQKNKRAS